MDNIKKAFKVSIDSTFSWSPSSAEEVTEKELWDIYTTLQTFPISWLDLMYRLDTHGSYSYTDYLNNYNYTFTKIEPEKVMEFESSRPGFCRHDKKFINNISRNLKFWYCPDCKKDLGDA
jgi:hypothetical protein